MKSNYSKVFLLISVIGLTPIALGYGAAPALTLDMLFGINVDTTNLTHIFRAVMGLYFGMIVLWLFGAFNPSITQAALLSNVVFMFGLASGRVVSFVLDGLPHWLLIVYAILEVGFGIAALTLYKKNRG